MKPRLVLTGNKYPTPKFWINVRWENKFYSWGAGKKILVIDDWCYEYAIQYQTPERKELS
jgi:hypothetical protein